MSEIDRLKAAIVAAERDAALAVAADAQILAEAERFARESVEAAFAAYRAQIEELTGQIEAPGTYAGDPEPEPEPELGGDEEDPE